MTAPHISASKKIQPVPPNSELTSSRRRIQAPGNWRGSASSIVDPATGRPASNSLSSDAIDISLSDRKSSVDDRSSIRRNSLLSGSPLRRDNSEGLDSMGSIEPIALEEIVDSFKNTGQQMFKQMRLHREMSARQATQIARYGYGVEANDITSRPEMSPASPLKLDLSALGELPGLNLNDMHYQFESHDSSGNNLSALPGNGDLFDFLNDD